MIPYFRQETDYTCGAASMRMALAHLGIKKSEKDIKTGLETNSKRGTLNKHFPLYAEKMKLNYLVKRNTTITELSELVEKGCAVIVAYYDKLEKVGHYAVIKSVNKNEIKLLDPWHGKDHKLNKAEFLKVWKNSYEPDVRWLFAVLKN